MNTISWIIVAVLIIGIVLAFFASVRVMRSERCCGDRSCDSCARRRCSVLKDTSPAPCSDTDCPNNDCCNRGNE